jgi:hypothetical protein
MDRWKPVIERCLEEDRAMPRKQRHTAHRPWQRLVEEHGADVGETTVRRYVAVVRARASIELISRQAMRGKAPDPAAISALEHDRLLYRIPGLEETDINRVTQVRVDVGRHDLDPH